MTVSERALVRAAHDLAAYLQDGRKLWTVRSNPEQAVLQAARVRLGKEAAAYFPAPVVLAAAMTSSQVNRDPATGAPAPTGQRCRWCHARAAKDDTQVPVNQATLTLLGPPCEACLEYVAADALNSLDDLLTTPITAAAVPSVRDAIVLARKQYNAAAERNRQLAEELATDGG